MGVLGDIVERDCPQSTTSAPTLPESNGESKLGRKWRTRRTLHAEMERQKNQAKKAAEAEAQAEARVAAVPNVKEAEAGEVQEAATITNMEKLSLDEEEANTQRIANMSTEEAKDFTNELSSIDPAVLQALKKRAERKVANQKSFELGLSKQPEISQTSTKITSGPSRASNTSNKSNTAKAAIADDDSHPVNEATAHLTDPSTLGPVSHAPGAHFPPPPADLKEYFPDLPVETEKMAWMAPIDDDEEMEYSPELRSVAPMELRFDFQGNLITPRKSRTISPSLGLHHHGDAPSAAGYTLPELAHLARSSHPAQRSIAIQTAGRVLHKLRLKRFAKSSELQEALQQLVDRTRIIDTLMEAASDNTPNLTVRTLAVEALWLAKTDNNRHNHAGEGLESAEPQT